MKKKKIHKKQIVSKSNPEKGESRNEASLMRDALVSVFGEDAVLEIEQEAIKQKKFRMKFSFKPAQQFLDEKKHLFQISPEEKHERLINDPFLEYVETFQQQTFKYNIISINQIENEKWKVEYFDYHHQFQIFEGTKNELIKFFSIDEADLYYIAKVIIPKNNRIDSPFHKQLKQIRLKK